MRGGEGGGRLSGGERRTELNTAAVNGGEREGPSGKCPAERKWSSATERRAGGAREEEEVGRSGKASAKNMNVKLC